MLLYYVIQWQGRHLFPNPADCSFISVSVCVVLSVSSSPIHPTHYSSLCYIPSEVYGIIFYGSFFISRIFIWLYISILSCFFSVSPPHNFLFFLNKNYTFINLL